MRQGLKIPKVTFRTREGDEEEIQGSGCAIGGMWVDKTTDDYFKDKRVVLFSLPGAFTPTCSSKQLPGFEENYDEIRSLGIDEIYCMSVNDSFVMNAWAKQQNIQNVKVIPVGSQTLHVLWVCWLVKPIWVLVCVVGDIWQLSTTELLKNGGKNPNPNNDGEDDDPKY